ncbi:MAG: hypothetical protein J6M02_00935 [Clostridia bacterium]|nr:hypothetical protein [Clostridia bacterium]
MLKINDRRCIIRNSIIMYIISYLPQAIKLIKTKESKDLSKTA